MSKKQPIVAEVQQTGNSLISKLNDMQADIQAMHDSLKGKENDLKQKIIQQKKALDEQRQLEAERLIKMAEDEKANRKNNNAVESVCISCKDCSCTGCHSIYIVSTKSVVPCDCIVCENYCIKS